ncbi:MAG: HNH endonuclease, partial [Methanospirillum sp.]|nr:HNH endonuclease [Methanospirillum sp.]
SSVRKILGVEPCLLAYLEYLFHEAKGPYSPEFAFTAETIRFVFSSFPALRALINLNAPGAIANMVLNRRGRLKFLISDQTELAVVLDWWKTFGLVPVTQKEVFDAVLDKPTIPDRLERGDPLLILRLCDVFPEYEPVINPRGISRSDLHSAAGTVTHPPSERRYRRVYESYAKEGRDIWSVIHEEEQRILPIQVKRNRFLAYLVRMAYGNSCQVCRSLGEVSPGQVTVHHIVPLSRQGKDLAENMLVVCMQHHQAIHTGAMDVSVENGMIRVRSQKSS